MLVLALSVLSVWRGNAPSAYGFGGREGDVDLVITVASALTTRLTHTTNNAATKPPSQHHIDLT